MGRGGVRINRTLINFNGWAGVGVLEHAKSVLTDNVVHNNGQSGLVLAEQGQAALLTNHLCNNGEFAAAVHGRQASLRGPFAATAGRDAAWGNTTYGNVAGNVQDMRQGPRF